MGVYEPILKTAGYMDHGIEDAEFVVICTRGMFGPDIKSLQRTADSLGMRSLAVNAFDYTTIPNPLEYWLIGSQGAMILFSLKYKHLIIAQLNQPLMEITVERAAFLTKKHDGVMSDHMHLLRNLATDRATLIRRKTGFPILVGASCPTNV